MEPWKLEPAHDHGLSPVDAARSLKRESGLIHTAGHFAWSAMVRSYLRIYHRLSVQGREHLPTEPPFILIANHASHLDALVLAATLPIRSCDRIFPVAAGDVFFQTDPLAILSALLINALPMWRKNCGPHALEQLRDRLVQEPCAYILFPEGARSRDGRMLAFKAGLGRIVGGTTVPVVPCGIIGAYHAMRPESGPPRPVRIQVKIGPPLTFADAADDRQGWSSVAQRAQAAVEALVGPELAHRPEPRPSAATGEPPTA